MGIPIKATKVGPLLNPVGLEEMSSADPMGGDLIRGFMGRNRLINGDLRYWQRNVSFASALVYYAADRWLVQGGSSTTATSRLLIPASQTVIPGNPRAAIRCAVSSVAGAANYASLRQRIEGVDTLAGRKATFSFWAKADAARNISVEFCQRVGTAEDVLAIGVTKLALTTSWAKYTVKVDIPVFVASIFGVDYLELFLWLDAGSSYNARTDSLGQQSGTFDFTMLQLEEGEVATTYDWRPDALELALCQRYYEKSYDLLVFPGAASAFGRVGEFLGVDRTRANSCEIQFKVSKRGTPSVSVYASETGAANSFSEDNGVAKTITGLSAIGHNGFQVTYVNSSGRYGGSFHYVADAEF